MFLSQTVITIIATILSIIINVSLGYFITKYYSYKKDYISSQIPTFNLFQGIKIIKKFKTKHNKIFLLFLLFLLIINNQLIHIIISLIFKIENQNIYESNFNFKKYDIMLPTLSAYLFKNRNNSMPNNLDIISYICNTTKSFSTLRNNNYDLIAPITYNLSNNNIFPVICRDTSIKDSPVLCIDSISMNINNLCNFTNNNNNQYDIICINNYNNVNLDPVYNILSNSLSLYNKEENGYKLYTISQGFSNIPNAMSGTMYIEGIHNFISFDVTYSLTGSSISNEVTVISIVYKNKTYNEIAPILKNAEINITENMFNSEINQNITLTQIIIYGGDPMIIISNTTTFQKDGIKINSINKFVIKSRSLINAIKLENVDKNIIGLGVSDFGEISNIPILSSYSYYCQLNNNNISNYIKWLKTQELQSLMFNASYYDGIIFPVYSVNSFEAAEISFKSIIVFIFIIIISILISIYSVLTTNNNYKEPFILIIANIFNKKFDNLNKYFINIKNNNIIINEIPIILKDNLIIDFNNFSNISENSENIFNDKY